MVSRDISIGGVLDGVPRGAGDEEEVLLDEDPVDNEIRWDGSQNGGVRNKRLRLRY